LLSAGAGSVAIGLATPFYAEWAAECHGLGVYPSVCVSHPGPLSKRCKLKSRNPLGEGFPSNEGIIKGYPIKKTSFCRY